MNNEQTAVKELLKALWYCHFYLKAWRDDRLSNDRLRIAAGKRNQEFCEYRQMHYQTVTALQEQVRTARGALEAIAEYRSACAANGFSPNADTLMYMVHVALETLRAGEK